MEQNDQWVLKYEQKNVDRGCWLGRWKNKTPAERSHGYLAMEYGNMDMEVAILTLKIDMVDKL